MNIPYFSQVGFGADEHHNDCGAACCSMVVAYLKDISVSPDSWYDLDGWNAPETDVGTYAWQLRKALALFDVDSFVSDNYLYQVEFQENPVIALVDYKVLADAKLTWVNASFLHWVLVTNYVGGFVTYHDPYFPNARGANITTPYRIFNNAYRWSNVVAIKPKEDLRLLRKPGDRFGKPKREVK